MGKENRDTKYVTSNKKELENLASIKFLYLVQYVAVEEKYWFGPLFGSCFEIGHEAQLPHPTTLIAQIP